LHMQQLLMVHGQFLRKKNNEKQIIGSV